MRMVEWSSDLKEQRGCGDDVDSEVAVAPRGADRESQVGEDAQPAVPDLDAHARRELAHPVGCCCEAHHCEPLDLGRDRCGLGQGEEHPSRPACFTTIQCDAYPSSDAGTEEPSPEHDGEAACGFEVGLALGDVVGVGDVPPESGTNPAGGAEGPAPAYGGGGGRYRHEPPRLSLCHGRRSGDDEEGEKADFGAAHRATPCFSANCDSAGILALSLRLVNIVRAIL